jgi:(4-(4-[2-(gamma-L-glutamylamino)ethyl]phenoxymethyl)furan-2-yl)methanamine synthase
MAFPLWKERHRLGAAVAELLSKAGSWDAIALTMTGELADCYRDRACGVRDILTQVLRAAAIHPVWVYTVDGQFRTSDEVFRNPDQAAAANWHALAQFAARWLGPRPGVLVDVGSTTCDVIPLSGGVVATKARTDFDRLAQEQLIYFGIGRTPICAVVHQIPYRNQMVPLMAELFATTDDVCLTLGLIEEDANDRQTSDGRPRTRAAARNRLARLIGLDHRHFDRQDAEVCSRHIWYTMRVRLRGAIERNAALVEAGTEPITAIISGHGAALAEPLPTGWRVIRAADRLGHAGSRAAPAYAVAVLASQMVALQTQ